ncbi:MAG: ParB/RepB/Spo0J family partition protein [Anaerolineales bacterium]|nr:ParB/RepB/Spo0J family partition protein [Anaerolineales bacterium]MCB0019004.1 ParB/RepB/Spo0J family partition protein [Anaerolineales bacterium]
MTKRRGLGKGLSALIPESNMPLDTAGLKTIAVTAISPNPHQPRSHMDEEKLEELAASIREHGLIQPLIVNEYEPGKYFLIAGERRWRACQRAGVEMVPVVVKEATAQDMLELAIIENVQRADLNAVEEAVAYRQLMDEFGLTQEQVAQRMGKSRPAIANAVRLLTLPEAIQEAVVDGQISGGHARTLVSLPTEKVQLDFLIQLLRWGWNVRQTEAYVRALVSLPTEKMQLDVIKQIAKHAWTAEQTAAHVQNLLGNQEANRRAAAMPRLSPEMRDLQKQFRESLGTKVSLQPGADGKGGKLVIHYFSDEELQHIFETIVEK